MRFLRSEDGNAAAEYAVLLGTIAAGLVLAMTAFQSALGSSLNASAAHVAQAGAPNGELAKGSQ